MSEIYDSIMRGLEEAVEYVQGNNKARVHTITVEPVPSFDAKSVKEVRNNLGMTQVVFASVMGVSKKTVEAWGAGTNIPNGPSSRLLEMFRSNPQYAKQFVNFNY